MMSRLNKWFGKLILAHWRRQERKRRARERLVLLREILR
jgi:hypothetical protein